MFCGYAQIKTHRNWWITADPFCDIGEYYRSIFNFEYRAYVKIQKPKWGYHISVLRKEEPNLNKDKFEEKNGLTISFEYDNVYNIGDNHIWFDVFSKDIDDLRRFFGLPIKPEYPLHLTIGYIENIYNINWLHNQREVSERQS